jgi:hypothetical protein
MRQTELLHGIHLMILVYHCLRCEMVNRIFINPPILASADSEESTIRVGSQSSVPYHDVIDTETDSNF